MNIQELLHGMAERVSASASVKNVYGEPVTVGGRTVIPVAQVRYGFGGGGGGVSARPCGALEISADGSRFILFDDRRKLGAALVLGFVLGAAVVAITQTRRIEAAKRPDDSV